MAIEVDFSDFTKLAADVSKIAPGAEKTLKQAVEVTSRNVKDAWNGKLYREGHAKRTGRAITYDVTVTRDSIEADIGAVRGSGRQAGVVRLLENGSINNGANGYGAAALHENETDFETGISKALDDAFKQAGL